jgi:hypothetical protein
MPQLRNITTCDAPAPNHTALARVAARSAPALCVDAQVDVVGVTFFFVGISVGTFAETAPLS